MKNSSLRLALVVSSSILYGVAYIFPFYLWWTVTIFLTPLFYLLLREKLTPVDGLVWSTIAFSLHLFSVLEGIFFIAEGHFLFRICVPILVLCTAIFYGVTCFFIASHFKQMYAWVILFWLFFLWMEHCCLFMLGACEGYLLISPLVPLVEYPPLLYFLPKIGSSLLLFVLVITQAEIAVAYVNKKFTRLLVCLAFWALALVLWHTSTWHRPKGFMHTFSKAICGTAYFKKNDNISYTGRVIRDYCKALLLDYPEAVTILFPETAIRCPILPGEPNVVELFSQEYLGKPVTIIIGGFRWDETRYRNTVYWIHDGKIIDLFDKRHAMALTERAPSEFILGNVSLIKDGYFKTFVGVNPSSCKRPVWHISPELTIIPYICSELFFNNFPDHSETQGAILVALCNDDWLKRRCMRYQMLMGARYRATQWQIPIIYVAHYYQAFCQSNGAFLKLKSFGHNELT